MIYSYYFLYTFEHQSESHDISHAPFLKDSCFIICSPEILCLAVLLQESFWGWGGRVVDASMVTRRIQLGELSDGMGGENNERDISMGDAIRGLGRNLMPQKLPRIHKDDPN